MRARHLWRHTHAFAGLGAQTDEQGNSTLSKGLKDYDSILSQLAQQFGTPKTDKAKKKKKKKHRHKCVPYRAVMCGVWRMACGRRLCL